jgi:hypothetical protein
MLSYKSFFYGSLKNSISKGKKVFATLCGPPPAGRPSGSQVAHYLMVTRFA